MTKRIWAVLLAVMLLAPAVLAEGELQTVLYADFTCGQAEPAPEDISQYEMGYSGELTAEVLVNGLSALTGLDFAVTTTALEDGIAVDWSAESTLVAGLGDRQTAEGFAFSDANALNWFMLDSLWRTLTLSLPAQNVYYTMDGGSPLALDGLAPAYAIPSDAPYQGSAYYFAQAQAAAVSGIVLVGTLPKDAQIVESVSDETGAYMQTLLTSDGAIWITTLRQPLDDAHPAGLSAQDFALAYFAVTDAIDIEVLEAAPVAGYPAQRVRFTEGQAEDTTRWDVLLIGTDTDYFALAVHTSLDIWEGMTDGYAQGDVEESVNLWIESLDLFDSGI